MISEENIIQKKEWKRMKLNKILIILERKKI